jgi:hypothetical protein
MTYFVKIFCVLAEENFPHEKNKTYVETYSSSRGKNQVNSHENFQVNKNIENNQELVSSIEDNQEKNHKNLMKREKIISTENVDKNNRKKNFGKNSRHNTETAKNYKQVRKQEILSEENNKNHEKTENTNEFVILDQNNFFELFEKKNYVILYLACLFLFYGQNTIPAFVQIPYFQHLVSVFVFVCVILLSLRVFKKIAVFVSLICGLLLIHFLIQILGKNKIQTNATFERSSVSSSFFSSIYFTNICLLNVFNVIWILKFINNLEITQEKIFYIVLFGIFTVLGFIGHFLVRKQLAF